MTENSLWIKTLSGRKDDINFGNPQEYDFDSRHNEKD